MQANASRDGPMGGHFAAENAHLERRKALRLSGVA